MFYFHLYSKPRCFWRNLHRWQKFYTPTGSDGSDKFHLWVNIHIFNKQWISAKIPNTTTMRPTFCLAASMRPDCATWRFAQTHRQKRCIGQLWVQLVMLAIWQNKWPVTMKTWQLRTANAYWCQVWPVHNYIDFKNLCWRFKQQDICLSYPSK